MEFWEIALLSFAAGLFVILVVVPLAVIYLMTLFDVLARIDIGIGKLVWLPIVMLMPLGLLVYWLFRPKHFNPWEEKQDPAYAPLYVRPQFAMATAGSSVPVTATPAPRLTVVAGNPAPPSPEAPPQELERAA